MRAADHVDAQRAPAGAHGRDRALGDAQQLAGVGQERLPVDGELGAARGAGEQPHAEVPLQRGDALGDGLLGDRQLGGGLLELPGVRDGDEGAHGVEVHAADPSCTTAGCGSPAMRLFDPGACASL